MNERSTARGLFNIYICFLQYIGWERKPYVKPFGNPFYILLVFKITESLQGYLRFKTITSQNASSEAQINDFFIS